MTFHNTVSRRTFLASTGAAALHTVARDRYLRTFSPDVVTRRLIGVYETMTGPSHSATR